MTMSNRVIDNTELQTVRLRSNGRLNTKRLSQNDWNQWRPEFVAGDDSFLQFKQDLKATVFYRLRHVLDADFNDTGEIELIVKAHRDDLRDVTCDIIDCLEIIGVMDCYFNGFGGWREI